MKRNKSKSVFLSAAAFTLGQPLVTHAYTHMSNPYAWQQGACEVGGSADINFQPGFAYSFHFAGEMYGAMGSVYSPGSSGTVGGAPGTGPGNQVFYNGANRYANSWGSGWPFMLYQAGAWVSWSGGNEGGYSDAGYMDCSSS